MNKLSSVLVALAAILVVGLFLSNRSSQEYDRGYEAGYTAGYDNGYDDGYDPLDFTPIYDETDNDRDVYEDGYNAGFSDACVIILDRMDPAYREQWMQDNADAVERFGIVY
ncbi:MAG: hypothetical protein MJ074_06775 [Oscillospiraceae bacterium]|nr:hypothetical protein [Oscillospiraceae bacterium]